MRALALLADKLEARARALFELNTKTVEARRFKPGPFDNTHTLERRLHGQLLLGVVSDIRSAIKEIA